MFRTMQQETFAEVLFIFTPPAEMSWALTGGDVTNQSSRENITAHLRQRKHVAKRAFLLNYCTINEHISDAASFMLLETIMKVFVFIDI